MIEKRLAVHGLGSGVIVTEEGHIITAYHVIQNKHALRVTLSNGKSVSVRLVGVDPELDIAVLQVENPYIAKAKIKRLRRYVPVSKNHLSGSIPTEMLWDTDLTYAPVLELGGTRTERFERYNQMEEILAELPGLDCGSCGAPTCAALAEDVVRGKAAVNDCTVLMRRRMEAVLKALGKGE